MFKYFASVVMALAMIRPSGLNAAPQPWTDNQIVTPRIAELLVFPKPSKTLTGLAIARLYPPQKFRWPAAKATPLLPVERFPMNWRGRHPLNLDLVDRHWQGTWVQSRLGDGRALSSVALREVPAPAGVPLFLAGLGSLAILRGLKKTG